MIRNLTVLFIGGLMSLSAFAGDNGGGQLDCVSGSGRTKLSGIAGYDMWGNSELTFTIDGQSINLAANQLISNEVRTTDFVINDEGKAYSVVVKVSRSSQGSYVYAEPVLALRSVPGTMKKTGAVTYSFSAIIPAGTTVDPRVNKDLYQNSENFGQDIGVKCTLDVGV